MMYTKTIIKKLLCIAMLCSLCMTINAQDVEWVKSIGGTEDEYAESIAIGPAGNIYITGGYKGTVDFDPGSGTHTLTSSLNGNSRDIFLQKLSPDGDLIWVKTTEASNAPSSSSMGKDIAFDALGNVYVTGYCQGSRTITQGSATTHFRSAVDFDPSPNIDNPFSHDSEDMFVWKLDTTGNYLWAKLYGEDGGEVGNFIEVSDDGNHIYIGGGMFYYNMVHSSAVFGAETVDLNPSYGVYNVTIYSWISSMNNFAWIRYGGYCFMKLDGLGNIQDAQISSHFGFFSQDDYRSPPSAMTISPSGEIYASGYETYNYASGRDDGSYLARINTHSNASVWGGFIGREVEIFGIALDRDDNIIYGATVNPFSQDIEIGKRRTRNPISNSWTKHIQSNNEESAYSLATDTNENIYVTGYFTGSVDFNPDTGVHIVNPTSSNNTYVMKLDKKGNFRWVTTFDETLWPDLNRGGNYLSNSKGERLAVGEDGSLYMLGMFDGTRNFGTVPSPLNVTSNGGTDVFLIKIRNCIKGSRTIEADLCEGSYTLNGITYNTPGTYVQTLTDTTGCDSIINLDITGALPIMLVSSNPYIQDFETNPISDIHFSYEANAYIRPDDDSNNCFGDSSLRVHGIESNATWDDNLEQNEDSLWNASSFKNHYAYAQMCVDATGITGCELSFALNHTYLWDKMQSRARVLIDGVQISPSYIAMGYSGASCRTHKLDLSAYAGTKFELLFQFACKTEYDRIYLDSIKLASVSQTSIEDELLNASIQIYPNPSQGNFHIQTSLTQDIHIQMRDLTGKTLESINIEKQSLGHYQIHASHLPQGVYLVEIQTEMGVLVKKVQIK